MSSKPSSSSAGSQSQSLSRQEKARLLAARATQMNYNTGDEEDPLISKDKNKEEEKKEADKGTILITAFVLMLIFSLGNRIFGRLETYPMHNYPLYMNLLSTFLYVPLCFVYIFPALQFTKWITKEQTEIPKFKFAVMGALDSISGIMATFAVNYISTASLIVLVQQSAIPISMLISRVSLNARYTTSQYVGAGIVLSGIVLVLLPTFFGPPAASTSSGSSNEVLWLVILVISCIPMTLSSVYKEKALGEVDIDIMYLNGWVAIFQTLFAIPLCLPSAALTGLSFSEIFPNLYGGMMCSMGYNTVTVATAHYQVDDCASAPLFVSVYLAFNIVYNLLIVVVLKYGSANILWMASTVIVPLSNVAFSLKITPGNKPLNRMDIVGLVVIMSGLIVYRFTQQLHTIYLAVTTRMTPEDLLEVKKRSAIQSAEEKKQTKLIGLNQIEALNALIDSRINTAERSSLFRSPAQVRGELLLRLGIPPSPHITLSANRTKNGMELSPRVPFSPQLMPKFRPQRGGTGTTGGGAGGVAGGRSGNTRTLMTQQNANGGPGTGKRANEI